MNMVYTIIIVTIILFLLYNIMVSSYEKHYRLFLTKFNLMEPYSVVSNIDYNYFTDRIYWIKKYYNGGIIINNYIRKYEKELKLIGERYEWCGNYRFCK